MTQIPRQFVLLAAIVGAVAAAWLVVNAQDQILDCDTSVYGVELELHHNPVLGTRKAIVSIEPKESLRIGVPPRYEISTEEEAQKLGIVLEDANAAPVSIFSSTFRKERCKGR